VGCAGSTNRTSQLNETKKLVLALFYKNQSISFNVWVWGLKFDPNPTNRDGKKQEKQVVKAVCKIQNTIHFLRS
jgi:hypothetical protein